MTEILFISAQLLLFFFLTIFPLNKITTPIIYKTLEKSTFNCLFVNILILFFFFLIFSFFRLNFHYLLFAIVIVYILFFLFFFKNIVFEIKNNKNMSLYFFFIIINFFLFINLAYNLEIGWDGLSTWLLKSNLFYKNSNYFDLFNEDLPFKQYPHLGAYTWAFFWKNSLMDNEYYGRLFFKYIYVVSLFVISNSIRNISNLKKIVIVFCLMLLSQDYDKILEGYQEYLLFSFLIFIGKLIEIIQSHTNSIKSNALFFFILLGSLLLPWIKNEGFFYSLFIVIIFFYFKIEFRYKFIFFLINLINLTFQTIIIKIIYKIDSLFQGHFNSLSYFFYQFNFLEYFERTLYISIYFIHGALKYPITLVYLLSLFYVFIKKKNIYDNRIYITFFILNILFIYGIYLLTKEDLIWHLQTSIKRLVLQTSGFYIFITISLINSKKFFYK